MTSCYSRWFSGTFLAVSLLLPAIVFADVIYLKNGKVVPAPRAWIDGDLVKYESPEGVRAIPKAQVDDLVHGDSTKPKVSRVPPEDLSTKQESPASQKAKPRLALLKSAILETGRDVRVETLAELKKKLADDPANAQKRSALVSALNWQTGNLILRGELEEALKLCQEALSQAPTDAATMTHLGIIQFEQGSYKEAEATFRRVATRGGEPKQTLHYLIGEACYAQDKWPAAIAEWQRALQISPLKAIEKRLAQAQEELKAHQELEQQDTRHFILRYSKQVANTGVGDEILRYLERAYLELRRTLIDTPPETIDVILYADQTYFDITRSPAWSSAMFDGKIRVPIKGIPAFNDKLRATLIHELSHAFIAGTIGKRCPTWFNEGIAQNIEGRQAKQYQKALADAKRKGNLIPLERLSQSYAGLTSAEAELAYAEALSAIEYLKQVGGPAAVRDVIVHLRDQRSFGESLAEVVRLGPIDFERAWVGSLSASASQ
ncbi:MAG: tetratricopeptide repeat protein [Acidobacteria bacterium]|nr:tetratricopeptide repeat protein [Acidobacteriota bacterium]MBI3658783.1 tetratricopeptide repeat protein [Acidobacteriota bacterium]